MRPFETTLILLVVIGHSVVERPRFLWKRKPPSLIAGFAMILVLFAIPWIVDSINRFGGVVERLTLASEQGFAIGVGFRLMPYIDYLGGAQQANNIFTEIPDWPGVVVVGFIIICVALAGFHVRRRVQPRSEWILMGALAVVGFAFYFVFAEQLRDRYLLYGLVFVLGLCGFAVARWVHGSARSRVVLTVGGLLLWTFANIAIAGPYQRARAI
ncbi:MAG TPA: hypothetical protein VJR05_07680, partial [Acidimicrobiia bacterium]|nr:hypothetical protein [Acidimicrobiia bacterium]